LIIDFYLVIGYYALGYDFVIVIWLLVIGYYLVPSWRDWDFVIGYYLFIIDSMFGQLVIEHLVIIWLLEFGYWLLSFIHNRRLKRELFP